MNSVLAAIQSVFAPGLQQAEQQATDAATVAAGWGIIVAVELAIVIFLLARRRG